MIFRRFRMVNFLVDKQFLTKQRAPFKYLILRLRRQTHLNKACVCGTGKNYHYEKDFFVFPSFRLDP